MSSSLVTIHNHEENVYIQHRNNGERNWIGLNDRSVEGSFVWTNHELSNFRSWAPRQQTIGETKTVCTLLGLNMVTLGMMCHVTTVTISLVSEVQLFFRLVQILRIPLLYCARFNEKHKQFQNSSEAMILAVMNAIFAIS